MWHFTSDGDIRSFGCLGNAEAIRENIGIDLIIKFKNFSVSKGTINKVKKTSSHDWNPL